MQCSISGGKSFPGWEDTTEGQQSFESQPGVAQAQVGDQVHGQHRLLIGNQLSGDPGLDVDVVLREHSGAAGYSRQAEIKK